jgi:hypothetical protein
VKEQNLRNDEDVTKDTLGICRTCIKEEECACICKKLIKNSASLPSRTSCAFLEAENICSKKCIIHYAEGGYKIFLAGAGCV